MPDSASHLWMWTAIYAVAAAYHFALWTRMPERQPEQPSYSAVCLGLAIEAAGAALMRTGNSGQLGLDLMLIGALATASTFVEFLQHFAPRRGGELGRHLLRATRGLALLGCVMVVAGMAHANTAGAGLTHAMKVLCVGMVVLVVVAYLHVLLRVPGGRAGDDARTIVWGSILGVAGAVFELRDLLQSRGNAGLMQAGASLALVAVSFVLLRRTVDASDELDRKTRELDATTLALASARSELVRSEQLAAVGELSAIIAHQVRNPLAIMKNSASNLRRKISPEDRATLLEILDEEIARLHRLARDLLTYARPVTPKNERISGEALLRSAYESVRRDPRHTARYEVEADVTVRGDVSQLRHAVTNLIDNAIEAMPRGGAVSLSARVEQGAAGPQVLLECVDEGEGINPAALEKALDPFFTTKSAGTGLGLAITDRIVRAHAGSVHIAGASPLGTRVTIRLPLAMR
jgi:signal transduction histidine kinase